MAAGFVMPKQVSSALAFLRRDFQIALSYRVPFLFDFVGAFFVIFEFYYLSQLVPEGGATGDYLGFVVTGLVVTTFLASTASPQFAPGTRAPRAAARSA